MIGVTMAALIAAHNQKPAATWSSGGGAEPQAIS
jgi:hypothetical protein